MAGPVLGQRHITKSQWWSKDRNNHKVMNQHQGHEVVAYFPSSKQIALPLADQKHGAGSEIF